MVLPDRRDRYRPAAARGCPALVLHAGNERGHRNGGLQLRDARMAPSMAAPPAMSYFIFSMPSAGLMEMPPVSNVTPLAHQAQVRRWTPSAAGR